MGYRTAAKRSARRASALLESSIQHANKACCSAQMIRAVLPRSRQSSSQAFWSRLRDCSDSAVPDEHLPACRGRMSRPCCQAGPRHCQPAITIPAAFQPLTLEHIISSEDPASDLACVSGEQRPLPSRAPRTNRPSSVHTPRHATNTSDLEISH